MGEMNENGWGFAVLEWGVMRENVKREAVTQYITHYVTGFPRQPGRETCSSVSACHSSGRLLLQLTSGIAQNAPRHDEGVNLTGTLKNIVDLGIAHPLLHQIFTAIPHGA